MEKHPPAILRRLAGSLRDYDWSRFRPGNMERRKLGWALRCLYRPLAAFTDIKYEGHGSLLIANILCACLFLVSALAYACEGFVFNYNAIDHFDVFVTLLSSSLLLFLWTVANWGVCSLLDGEGSFAEIWITTCYAMLPRILFTLPLIALSNILTLEEQSLYSTVSTILLVWCGVLLVLGMMTMHQYSVKKTIASVLLTIAGMAVILFIAVLFYSMFQQLVAFFQTIAAEFRYRL